MLGQGDAFGIGTADFHATDVAHLFDGDGCACFSLHALDNLATRSDDATDEALGNFHDDHTGSMGLQFGTWSRHGSRHDAQDVRTSGFRLIQGIGQDLDAEAFDLDVHLAGSDAFFGTRHLEVHVTEVIFVAQDVAQNGVFARLSVRDQAHGDTAYGAINLDTCIHHG